MKSVAKAVFSCFLLNAAVLGQSSTAQISGAVKDQTGALLPGAEITATQTDTGVARSTVSNETGSYVLQNLPVGPYKLEKGSSRRLRELRG